MKRLKRIYILLLSAVLIIGGSGCELNNSEIVKEEQAAHDEWLRWRKEFLAEQELPTEYSQSVSYTHQMCIRDSLYPKNRCQIST